MSQFFSSTRGGGEHLLHIAVTKLAENNHQVWIITNKITGEDYPVHKNIHIIFVPPVLKYQGGLPPSIKENVQYFINTVKMGKKIIKENNIDLIHSNNFTPALTGGFLSLISSKKHITSVWDIFTLCGCDYWKKWVTQTGVSKINQYIGPIFEKLVLKTRCDAFHTISDASKDDLIKFGARKPIYNILPAIENVLESKNEQNNKQFIYVGRLVFYKNVEILINAIKIAKNQDDKVRLVIVGGGPQYEKIQKMIESMNLERNIIMRGYVSFEEKIKLISESNAMLFPSICEGFGLVILESWQQGRPVIVSDMPPMSEIVEDGKTGYLTDPHDEKKWAEKIIHLIKNPEISDGMGKRGYQTLKEKYSQEKFYQNIISMYNDVLKSRDQKTF